MRKLATPAVLLLWANQLLPILHTLITLLQLYPVLLPCHCITSPLFSLLLPLSPHQSSHVSVLLALIILPHLTTMYLCFVDLIKVYDSVDHACHDADVLEECKEMRDQLRLQRIQWFGHLMHMPTHRPQRQILQCRPQGKRRQPGGTPLRWIDVQKDLASLHNWHQMVWPHIMESFHPSLVGWPPNHIN